MRVIPGKGNIDKVRSEGRYIPRDEEMEMSIWKLG